MKLSAKAIQIEVTIASCKPFIKRFKQFDPNSLSEIEIQILFTALKTTQPEIHRKLLVKYGFSHGHACPKWLGGGSDAYIPGHKQLRRYARQVVKLLRTRSQELKTELLQ